MCDRHSALSEGEGWAPKMT